MYVSSSPSSERKLTVTVSIRVSNLERVNICVSFGFKVYIYVNPFISGSVIIDTLFIFVIFNICTEYAMLGPVFINEKHK